MSFSSEIKRELCLAQSLRELQPDQLVAMLYGMFYAGKTLDGRRVIQTESPELAAAAVVLAESVFPGERFETKRLVKNDGSLYTFSIRSPRLRERFGDLSEIAPRIVIFTAIPCSSMKRRSCSVLSDTRSEVGKTISK